MIDLENSSIKRICFPPKIINLHTSNIRVFFFSSSKAETFCWLSCAESQGWLPLGTAGLHKSLDTSSDTPAHLHFCHWWWRLPPHRNHSPGHSFMCRPSVGRWYWSLWAVVSSPAVCLMASNWCFFPWACSLVLWASGSVPHPRVSRSNVSV